MDAVKVKLGRQALRGFVPAVTVGMVAAMVTILVPVGAAHAATIVVSSTTEGAGSLRAAITEANGDGTITRIELPGTGPYILSNCGFIEDANNAGDLDVTGSQGLTIVGTNAGGRSRVTTICGDRIFDQRGSGSLRLEHLRIDGGDIDEKISIFGSVPAIEYAGGGIRSNGSAITLDDVSLDNNHAADGGNGNSAIAGGKPGADGGGLYSSNGTVIINDSEVLLNSAGNGGAGDGPSAPAAGGGRGGGVFVAAGVLSITNSSVLANVSGDGGSGTVDESGAPGGLGGGIYKSGIGNLVLTDSVVSNNAAGDGGASGPSGGTGGDGGDGGGVYGTSINVVVDGGSIVDNSSGVGGAGDGAGGGGGDGGGIFARGLTLGNVDVSDNGAGAGGYGAGATGGTGGSGGGVVALFVTATDVDLTDNSAGPGGSSLSTGGRGGDGGGIAAAFNAGLGGGSLTVTRLAASGNRAGSGGTGSNGGFGGDGGAIGNWNIGTPTMTVDRSWFRANRAGSGGAPLSLGAVGFGGHGGGIHNFANAFESTKITNSSFFENQAGTGSTPGHGAATATNNLTMRYTTIRGNGPGVAVAKARTGLSSFDRITASVIGGNAQGNCDIVTQSGGYNYEQGGNTCSFGAVTDRVGQAALGLGPISNGQSPPLSGGPLDAMIPAGACSTGFLSGITVDQTGATRPRGQGCEPGAVEIVGGGDGPGLDPRLNAATRFVPVPPTRIFDSRPLEPPPGPKGMVGPDDSVDVQVTGLAGVPKNAVGVVMNVTVTTTSAPGFVTAYPTGVPLPDSSSVNIMVAGQTRPNLVTVPIGTGGKVTLYSLASVDLIADVAGYFVDRDAAIAAGRFVPLTPSRLFDTRPTETDVPGPKGKLGPADSIDVAVLGQGDIPPSGVAAVVVNLTGTEASAPGFVAAYPAGSSLPNVSNVNLSSAGTTAPNLAIVPLGVGGKITVYSSHGTHVLGDVAGYITDSSAPVAVDGLFVPITPERLFDTRESESPPGPKGFLAPGGHADATIGGAGSIPSGAAGVVLNVVGIDSPLGFLTAWPTGPARPNASTLNFVTSPLDTRANGAWLPVGTGGRVSFFTLNGSDILADTSGYFLSSEMVSGG